MRRKGYIDAMRGLAALLVVFAHSSNAFSDFYGEPENSFIYNIIGIFFMPMFFMLSGYVSHGALSRLSSPGEVWEMVRRKSIRLLVPFFVVGLTFYYTTGIFQNEAATYPIWGLLQNGSNWGYWFLPSLWIMSVWSALAFPVYNLTAGKAGKHEMAGFIAFSVISILLLKLLLHPSMIVKHPTLFRTQEYYPYFILGLMLRRYAGLEKLVIGDRFNAMMFVVSLAGVFTVEAELISNHLISRMAGLGLAVSILLYLTGLFRRLDGCGFMKPLEYVGTRSLEIYVLHYFLLIGASGVKEAMGEGIVALHGILLSLLYITIITMTITVICILIGGVINSNPLLSLVVLGKEARKVPAEKGVSSELTEARLKQQPQE